MNDRYEKGHIDLLDTRVKKTKQYRFVPDWHHMWRSSIVLWSSTPKSNWNWRIRIPREFMDFFLLLDLLLEIDRNYHREFSADGQETMEDWIHAIQTVWWNSAAPHPSGYLGNRELSKITSCFTNNSCCPNKPPYQYNFYLHFWCSDWCLDLPPARLEHPSQPPEFSARPTTVKQWLEMIQLSQYVSNFQNCGYTNLQLVLLISFVLIIWIITDQWVWIASRGSRLFGNYDSTTQVSLLPPSNFWHLPFSQANSIDLRFGRI